MRMNSQMAAVWDEDAFARCKSLPDEVVYLIEDGWATGAHGALILRALFQPMEETTWRPSNVAEHEHETNDVWLPPDGLPVDQKDALRALVARASRFVATAFAGLSDEPGAESLVAVVSVPITGDDEGGATIKFFTRRGDFPHYYADLERYRDFAMMLVDRADVRSWDADGLC